MMNKKALGVGQVFIFILVVLTFGLITIFGYKAVTGFLEKGEQVQFVRFKTDLESAVKRISTDYGSVRTEDFRLPGKFSRVCFVDMDYLATDEEIGELCQYDELACEVWRDARQANQAGASGYDSVDDNVFLTPSAPVSLKVFKLRMGNGEGFSCGAVSGGKFTLRMQGGGSYALVSLVG